MTEDRGQTLPDFAFGMAIFFVAILFVAVIAPQLILPYDGQTDEILTQRFTTGLASEHLVEERPASALNETATISFFESSADDIKDQYAIPASYSVNATIRDVPSYRGDSSILCGAPGERDWIDESCQTGDRFAIGDTPPDESSSVSTSRVTLNTPEQTVVLEVRVW